MRPVPPEQDLLGRSTIARVRGTEHSGTGTAGLAWTLGALAVAASVATAVLAVVNRASIQSLEDASAIEVVLPLGFAVIGVVVATRRQRNPAGWLYLFAASVLGLSGVATQYARFALLTHPGLPGADWAELARMCEGLVYPSGAAVLLMLVLPDGRLPSPRWRVAVWASLIVTPLLTLLGALNPGRFSSALGSLPALDNPLGVSTLQGLGPGPVGYVVSFAALSLTLAGAAAPLVRVLTSRGEERQRAKWIAAAVVTATVVSFAVNAVWNVVPSWERLSSTIGGAAIILGFGVGVPVATGIAIFRHRLFDIDIVISRALVYGALAAFITAVYVVIAVGLGSLIGAGPNVWLSLVATAVVAVGFQPARERVQRVANRLVYGDRATPYQVLSRFSQRVAESHAVDEVLGQMARALAEGTGSARADIWLCDDGVLRAEACWPREAVAGEPLHLADPASIPTIPSTDRAVPVLHQGRLLGALSITKRPGDAVTPIEDRLLTDLAHQAGLVLRNAGLTVELVDRLEELRSSRQRLVTAQDAERRRLERDLHDGAQQHLVALRMKLGLAETLAGRDPDQVRTTLRQLKSDAEAALETLRELACGIYPPLLADRGLVTALEAHARTSGVPVDVRAAGIARYPREVEGCVYFCCLEALQNVQKYAAAQHVVISLARSNGSLHFEIRDDGTGFDVIATARGAGLQNMTDRVDALGGRLEIDSDAGGGTTLRGEVPIRPA